MQARPLPWIAVGLLLLINVAQGRRVDYHSREEMQQKSALVCDALVISVSPTNLKPETQFPPKPGDLPLIAMQARLKVLHISKGAAPKEITFQYNVLAPRAGSPLRNGPCLISLEAGERLHFFLVRSRLPDVYYSVLWYSPDECHAVELL